MICLLAVYFGLEHLDIFNIHDRRERKGREGAIWTRSCSEGCINICRGFDCNPSPDYVIRSSLQECDNCEGIGGDWCATLKTSDDAGHASFLGGHRGHQRITARRAGARGFDWVSGIAQWCCALQHS